MFNIVRKELRSFFKDRRALLITFFVPTVIITLFSFAFGRSDDSAVQTIPLLVVDEDRSEISKDVLSNIDSVKMIKVIHATNDSALQLIKKGKRSAALVLHKGFGDSVNAMKSLPWELEYDEAQAQSMAMLQQFLGQNLFGKVGKKLIQNMVMKNMKSFTGFMSAGNSTQDTITANVNKGMDNVMGNVTNTMHNTMKLKMTSVVKSAGDNPGIVQAVAGTAVMMLLFSLTAMGGRILEEKENGTLKRLLYSPLHSNEILLGKMVTSITIAFMQLMVMLIYASLLFGLHLWTKLPPVILLVLVTAFACSGFGVFLASVARSREQLQGLSTLVILTMSALGGSMIPTMYMPDWMQVMGQGTVNFWSIQGFYDIFWRQLPITDPVFLQRIGILLAIGVALTVLSFRFFRKNILSIA